MWPFKTKPGKPAEVIIYPSMMNGSIPITLDLGKLNVHHTYAQKPPIPRPERLTVCYQLQDGQEYKVFIPMHGQGQSYQPWPFDPAWQQRENWPPVIIKYYFDY